jgi:hypothetical protein
MRFLRQGGIYRSDVVQTKTKVKTKTWAEDQPPPAGRPRYPGKRTRREDHALLIVRDEFRTGYSLIGLLASRARLRLTGIVRISDGQRGHMCPETGREACLTASACKWRGR